MGNKALIVILAEAMALSNCTPQKEISQLQLPQNPCKDEWTDKIYFAGQEIANPPTIEEYVEGNISGTKRSNINGTTQPWETFQTFGKNYYVKKDTTAQNPLGFDLTKKELIAIAYSPITGKTEAIPFRIYHPVQIVDNNGNPYKELILDSVDLQNPEISGCKINKNQIDFKDYRIETKVINNQTYLILKAQRKSNEARLLDICALPLTADIQLVQDFASGKLKITSTKDYPIIFQFLNEELMKTGEKEEHLEIIIRKEHNLP